VSRYHLHFRDGSELFPDLHGHEHTSVGAAVDEALAVMQEFQSAHPGRQDWSRCAFEVSDSSGRILAVVPFEAGLVQLLSA
jgi:hypothetical protein